MIVSQQVTVEIIDRMAVLNIAVGGEEYITVVDLHRWPYRWSTDSDSGRRLTLRGSVMAAMHAITIERARDRGTSRRGLAKMRLMWAALEVRAFAQRWYERDRELFPHFVEKPTGIR